jgi:hypothetical protein
MRRNAKSARTELSRTDDDISDEAAGAARAQLAAASAQRRADEEAERHRQNAEEWF